jgi:hypothetical protein
MATRRQIPYGRFGVKDTADTSRYIRGDPYVQLFHTYPSLTPFYTDFEKKYDVLPILDGMAANNYVIPFIAVATYLAVCYFGAQYMSNRTAFVLRWPLAMWNLLLSIFSIYGTIRVVPHLLDKMTQMTFEETVCDSAHTYYGAGAAGLAVQLFILSKIPELFDTVFIILKKKPLIFLHWYHHITVLLFCWNSYVTESGAGIYFAAMNYTVHAVMYLYYFLQAVRILPRWFPSWIITLLQIAQMLIGTAIVTASLYYYLYGGSKYGPGQCHNKLSNVVAGVTIYSSYLYLFIDYAFKRFVLGLDMDSGKSSSKGSAKGSGRSTGQSRLSSGLAACSEAVKVD